MKKMLLAVIAGLMVMLSFSGCSEKGQKVVSWVDDNKETIYKVGEAAGKAFIPEETKEKYGLKEKNEFVKETYKDIKAANEKK